MPEDPAGEPVGMEDLERVGLLAGAHELDGQARDGRDRERRATARVAVDLGEDEARDADRVAERLGDGDGLLAHHRVHDEQRLDRLRPLRATARISAMSGVVHVEATGRVEDDDVAPGPACLRDAPRGDVHDRRAVGALVHGDVQDACPSVTSWSTAAGRYGSAATSIGWRPWRTIQRASLAEEVVLPEPWRPTIAMTAGEPSSRNVRSPAPRIAVSSSWTILTTIWPALTSLDDLRTDGAFLDAADEVLDDLVVDVRLEQREADLAHRDVDILLGDPAVAGQPAEGATQAVGEGVEHWSPSLAVDLDQGLRAGRTGAGWPAEEARTAAICRRSEPEWRERGRGMRAAPIGPPPAPRSASAANHAAVPMPWTASAGRALDPASVSGATGVGS